MAKSVLEAIQDGQWDFEPDGNDNVSFAATEALPGTGEKLKVLAERIKKGLPLWHPEDRHTYDGRLELDEEMDEEIQLEKLIDTELGNPD